MNMVTSRGIVEPGVAIMGGADMEEVADEDQDLDLDHQCADVDAHPPDQEVALSPETDFLHVESLHHDPKVDQFQGIGALQEIAATLNVEAQHLDLEAALFQKEGL